MLNSAQCESSKDDFHISTWKKIILVWRTGILYQCQTANSIKMLLWMSPQSNGDSLRCQSWFRNCMTKNCEHIFFSYIEHVFKIHTNHLVLFFFQFFVVHFWSVGLTWFFLADANTRIWYALYRCRLLISIANWCCCLTWLCQKFVMNILCILSIFDKSLMWQSYCRPRKPHFQNSFRGEIDKDCNMWKWMG